MRRVTRPTSLALLTVAALVILATMTAVSPAADPDIAPRDLPLLSIKDFKYVGAFRLPARKYGASDLNFSQGPIALNPDGGSLLIVGHAHHQAIAEFPIPPIVNSTVLSELKMAGDPIQPFVKVLDRPADGNPDGNNNIGGMAVIPGPKGPELLVNTYEYYDAPGDNTVSMLVVRNANDLANSKVDGYFPVQAESV